MQVMEALGEMIITLHKFKKNCRIASGSFSIIYAGTSSRLQHVNQACNKHKGQ